MTPKAPSSRSRMAAHICPCGAPVPPHLRECPVCGRDNGCPNVRAAASAPERDALQVRLKDAEISADARGCLSILNEFGVAVASSRAVIARSLGVLHDIAKSDNLVHVPFHRQVASGSRLPEINEWDQGRVAAESTILPNYHEKISFAALSLEDRGLAAFGPYSIVLRDEAVALRASVFEENPFKFNQRHRVYAGQPPPLGYRAPWSERHILAKAKLHHLLDSKTTPDRFAGVLMVQNAAGGDPDFIEVHIFGDIHRRAIKRVIGPQPKSAADRAIFRSVKRALDQVGAELEVT